MHFLLLFSGEGKDVTDEMTDPWKETTLMTILKNYAEEDIYNADEFGLFFKALPNKTLHLKDEKCSGGKHSKIRMTGLAAASMKGEKLPMFVIGKSQKPRCFKNLKQFPCRYRGQKKSWMDSTLFEEWVRELDEKMEKDNRRIALIIDNCTAHPEIGGLKAIDIFFLPPNTTSVLQPMDQGVIRSLKAKYRVKVIQKMIEAIDKKKELPQISLLDAMKMLVLAWDEVTEKTVQNCFKKAGFTEIDENTLSSDDPFRALNDTIRQLSRLDENFKDLSAKDVASFDDAVPVTQGLMSDEEILSDILGNEVEEIQDEEDNGQDGASPLEKPTTSQLHDAIDTLMNYSMMIDTTELKALTIKVSRIVENEVIAGSRQSKLTEFFSV